MRNTIITILTIGLLGGLLPGTARSADYPPGVLYSTLLKGVQLYPGGNFSLYQIQFTFLPPAESKTVYAYNPDDGGELYALMSSSGDNIYRFDLYAQEMDSPYWLQTGCETTDLRTGDDLGSGSIDIEPGGYKLDFYLEGERFYTFDFSVKKLGGDDPFGDSALVLDGPWREWGYWYYYDADPTRNLQWKMWLRSDTAANRSVTPRLEVSRAGGGVVCVSREHTTITLRPQLTRFEFDMVFPPEKQNYGEYFKASDLLGQDGDYMLKVYLGEEHIGDWSFTIDGGKFQPEGRTLRGEADPLTFVEGGKDAFWYQRD